MDEITCCSICLEEINGDSHTLDGCDHTFHARCIINWLRRGNLACPLCRCDLHRAEENIDGMALRERASYLRAFSRRSCAPVELKRLVAKLQKAEKKERESKRDYRDYRHEHREIIKKSRQKSCKRYTAHRKVSSLKRLLGLYQSPGLQLPALNVRPHDPYSPYY